MSIDIDEAGAIFGLMHQMVVPDLVVQRGRFGHERQLRRILYLSGEARRRTRCENVSAASTRAAKLRHRRRREAPEEAAGQATAIVDHDASANRAGLIWNHFSLIAHGLSKRDMRLRPVSLR
jgi:hypothetical protein